MEEDNDGDGPLRTHMETIVNYVTMTTDISLKVDIILDKMERFIGFENCYELSYMYMEVNSRMKEMIKVLQEKEPENCLQILVDVLVECECLKNTGWKEKPDPISALLLELRESISVIERLMESVKEGDVDEVKQLLSQYPIPQDMEHITRECCVLSLERHDLTLVKFSYQKYGRLLDNEETLKHILTKALRLDFTEGVQFLFSQGLPPEENIHYCELLEEAKSVDMLRLFLSEEKIRKSLNDEPRFTESVLYDQILNSSTQPDCMSRVQILVDAGARVENFIDKTKWQAWLKIIKERWFEVFDYLLNQLNDMNFTNRYQENILHVILVRECDSDVRNNILDFVRNLVERGIDVNSVDLFGKSPLMLSCRAGYYEVVKYLSERGADVNKVDNEGQTALIWACEEGNKSRVECLIHDCGADVNMVDFNGKTALMCACREGYKDVVECLIQHGGADVNMVDNDGQTALMWACEEGHKDVVEYLIQHGGPDVNMENKNGQTALYYCLGKSVLNTKFEQNNLFKFMVESGANLALPSNGVRLFEKILERKLYELFLFVIILNPQIVDVTDNGDNILHLLAKVNYEFTVGQFDWLFDGHVDINYENRHTDTPLMVAAVLLNEKYLEVFTHHPAVDLNKQNKHGHTALHCLILGFTELIQGFRRRHNEGIAQNYCKQFYPMYMKCVDSLLGAGTDVNVQDNEGRTVLMMAVRENDKQLVRKLLDAGAMVDKVDRSGRHALHFVDFSDSVYDLTIFFLIFPSGENHLLDLPCIHGNTLIQTVLQFPRWWEPCKVVAFVRWLVSRNCSLRHLRGRTGHSTYNDLSLDDFSCSQRQNLRELLYRSGAPKEEIISTVNVQTKDEAENAMLHSRNREMFEQSCLNVSLRSMCIRAFRQLLGTEIRSRLPGLEVPHLNNFLLLEDVVGDGDDGVLGGFDELEDESDYCSYIVDKDREYFHYLEDTERTYPDGGRLYRFYELDDFADYDFDYYYDDDDDDNYDDIEYDDDDDDDDDDDIEYDDDDDDDE